MDKYLVVLPHTHDDCVKSLQQIEAIGMITHFDWGCKDGEHVGWVMLEAESKAEAIMVVPTSQRRHAQVIKLNKFSPEDIKGLH